MAEQRRRWFLLAGALVAAIALAPPITASADQGLTSHMFQHVVLLSVAAPLLALGAPRRLTVSDAAAVSVIAAAVVVQAVVMVGWHIPVLYDSAVDNVPLHMTEHLSVLAAGVFFWWVVLAVPRRRYGFSVLALFVSALPCTLLGAGLALSSSPWYRTYSSITDQQTAGVVMWVVPGAVFAIAGAALMATWVAGFES